MSEAERLCDEIAIIHAGKIASRGTVAELRQATGKDALESGFLTIVGQDDPESKPPFDPIDARTPKEGSI